MSTTTGQPQTGSVEMAHLLMVRGQLYEARDMLETIIAREPANREAHALLERVGNLQLDSGLRGDGFQSEGNPLQGMLVGTMQVGGWISIVAALALLVTLLIPDRDSMPLTMPVPVLVPLSIALIVVGAALVKLSARIGD